MSIDTNSNSDVSVTQLLSGIVADAQDLGLRHLELFRSELLDEIHKTTEALVSMAVGFAVLQIGGLLFGHMLAQLLLQLAPTLSIWQSYAIVGCVVACCGAIPLYAGIARLRSLNPMSRAMTRDS